MTQKNTVTALFDQMSSSYTPISPGTYTCPVDGILFGLVNGAGSTCMAYAWASCAGAGVWASGGTINIGNDSSGNPIVFPNGNTLVLATPANQPFSFGQYINSYGSSPSTVVFYYLPLGDGSPSQSAAAGDVQAAPKQIKA